MYVRDEDAGEKERRADIVNEQFCTTAENTPNTYRITTIDAACQASPADYLSIATIEDKHNFDMLPIVTLNSENI